MGEPMTLAARADRLGAAGAIVEMTAGGGGTVGPSGDFPSPVDLCTVTLRDGTTFVAGGETHEEAQAAAFRQAEIALGLD